MSVVTAEDLKVLYEADLREEVGNLLVSKDSGRYKVANCTQAQPVFYGFAGLPDGKVILVSVLRRNAWGCGLS